MIFRCFIIIPYRDKFDRIYDTITSAATYQLLGHEIEFVRADRSILGSTLASNVSRHLELCDFAIADLSDKNPNVLFEAGYAIALRKPVIFIANQIEERLPSNLAEHYHLRYNESNLEDFVKSLTGVLRAAIETIQTTAKTDSFAVTAYNTLLSSDVLLAIKNAKQRIDILTLNLSSFFSIGIATEINASLQKAKVHVKILTLDPDSAVVNLRANQLGIPASEYREQLRYALNEAIYRFSNSPDRCQIRLYDEVPYQMLYIVDNHIYVTMISSQTGSRYSLTFKLNVNDAGAQQSFIANFAGVWSRAYRIREYFKKEYKTEP